MSTIKVSPFGPHHKTVQFDIVAMVSSAGGLAAVRHILEHLPGDFPASIVIVQHLDPRHRSLMADILSRLLVFVADTEKRSFLHYLDRLKTPAGRAVRNWELKIHPPRGSAVSASVNVTAQVDRLQQIVTLRWSLRDLSLPS